MAELNASNTAPRSEPESITRLRQITGTRTSVTVDTVEAWLYALTHEPWRGPADIAANPPISKALRRATSEKVRDATEAAIRRAKQREIAAATGKKPALRSLELTAAERSQIADAGKAARPNIVVVSEDQLLTDLADLGHFVYVSADETSDKEVAWADKFNLADTDADDLRADDDIQLPLTGMGHLPDRVLVDAKYSRKYCGKDLLRAVLRAVTFATDGDIARDATKALTAAEKKQRRARRDLLQRWVLRRHWGLRPQLTYPIVATVAMMAALERIEELDEVASVGGAPNPDTAAVLVEAWDFLVVGVDDAVRAAERICVDATAAEIDLESSELDRAVLRLRSLHEGVATRLERELRGARAAGDERRWQSAAAEFAARVATDPSRWNPEIGELNDAQILRLAGAGGLTTTEPDHRIEAEVRSWLTEAGLKSELATSLLWHGVNLHAAGHGDAFRAALTRRAAGDLGWASELNEIRVSASRVA